MVVLLTQFQRTFISLRLWLCCSLLFIFALAGCDQTQEESGDLHYGPGLGISFKNVPVKIGDTNATLQDNFGQPQVFRDLGDLGVQFEFSDFHWGGLLSGTGEQAKLKVITVYEGSEALIDEKINIGTNESSIREQFGEPQSDPFQKTWWYRSRGIAFDFKNGNVSKIHIYQPQ